MTTEPEATRQIVHQPLVPAEVEVELDEPSIARLEVLKTRVIDRAGGPKRSAIQIVQDWVADGEDLLEIKQLVGHGRFGHWVNQNFQFTHGTALNRMRLAKAVRNGMKIEIIAKLGLAAALKLVAPRVEPAGRKRRLAEAAFLRLSDEEQERRLWIAHAAQELLFVDDDDIARHEHIVGGLNQTVANREWPRPLEDWQAVIVQWEVLGNTAYIWLRRSASAQYKLLWWQLDRSNLPWESRVIQRAGPWENIHECLCELSDRFGKDGWYTILVADPIRTDILEAWWQREQLQSQDATLIYKAAVKR